MKQRVSRAANIAKNPIVRRVAVTIGPIMLRYIVKRLTKSESKGRKYVKNKAK